jgi:hypothetical protein
MVATSTTSQNMQKKKTLKTMLNFPLAKGLARVSLAHTIK